MWIGGNVRAKIKNYTPVFLINPVKVYVLSFHNFLNKIENQLFLNYIKKYFVWKKFSRISIQHQLHHQLHSTIRPYCFFYTTTNTRTTTPTATKTINNNHKLLLQFIEKCRSLFCEKLSLWTSLSMLLSILPTWKTLLATSTDFWTHFLRHIWDMHLIFVLTDGFHSTRPCPTHCQVSARRRNNGIQASTTFKKSPKDITLWPIFWSGWHTTALLRLCGQQ